MFRKYCYPIDAKLGAQVKSRVLPRGAATPRKPATASIVANLRVGLNICPHVSSIGSNSIVLGIRFTLGAKDGLEGARRGYRTLKANACSMPTQT